MTDKEVLIQSVEKYATDTVGKLFGITSLPAQTLIKYAVKNAANKYNVVLDLFTDKDGKIDTNLILNALKSEIKSRGGFTFMNVKFNEGDVDELASIISKLRMSSNIVT
jgi:hypothetical protein